VSTRDQAGRFVKGAPSPNPAGRGAKKAARPPGTNGVAAYSGFVQHGETNAALVGSSKWMTYANAVNKAVVATGLRYFFRLIAGTEWRAEPNPDGGSQAERAADVVRVGLLEAPMLKPWSRVAAKAGMYHPLGFSLHATAMRRRRDGLIVYSAIEHRPQSTIERWLRDAEDLPFHSAVQRSKETGREVVIPLEQCFYCVDDMLTDSPEGVGLLRHVIEYVRRLDLFEKWEGIAYEEDLNGIPYSRAPLAEIAEMAGTDDANSIKARTDAETLAVREFMAKRRKTPEQSQYLMLDSSTYRDASGNPTNVPRWDFQVLKGETANLVPMDAVIRRVELQIARVLGIEWALMGADGSGSYAMHDDKTSTFEAVVDDTLRELGSFATMQLARRLVAANGFDPDTCTPRLVAEPIGRETVEKVTRALANLSLAGLPPDDPAIPVLRRQMGLPFNPIRAAADLSLRTSDPSPISSGGDDPTGAEELLDSDPEDLAKIDARVLKMVRHERDGWHVYSVDGRKHLGGPYSSKQEALDRLRDIEGLTP
jgi:hypothetical protein